jgi:hypothetical protein
MFRRDPTMPPRITELEHPALGDRQCAIYFSRKRLLARNVELEIGSQFPLQAKDQIRGLAVSFGVRDADRLPFHELPYVGALVVPTHLYGEIRTKQWKYIDAAEFVKRRQGVRV